MALVDMHNLGSVGIIKDIPAHELAPEAWSDGNNVRFQDNKVLKITGHEQIFNPPSVVPYGLFPAPVETTFYWAYFGLAKAYVVQGATHTEITRLAGDYAMTTDIPWTGGLFQGLLIANNGVDVPQMWVPPGAGNFLSDLTAWPVGYTARILRSFGNYLVAFDVVKAGVRYPYLTLWSNAAEPGTVPDSWDVSDATKDAGDSPKLADTPGYILDALPLGNQLFIYKEDAIFKMSYVGGNNIMAIEKVFQEFGMLTHRCAVALPKGDSHFVVTEEDFILHNGNQIQHLGTEKIHNSVFADIDTSKLSYCHVVPNYPKHEIWFCYPSFDAQNFCNKAVIWNYVNGSFQFRDLPGTYAAAYGRLDATLDETYDADSETFDSDGSTFDERAFQGMQKNVILAGTTDTKLYGIDTGSSFNGTNMTAYVERTDLAIAGKDRFGNPKVDWSSIKFFRRIWIRATGEPFNVKMGTAMVRGGAVTWLPEQVFTPGVDEYLDFTASGRSVAVHFESTGAINWEIESYSIDVDIIGMF